MKGLADKLFLDNWPIRRRWLRLALIWMAINVQAILIASFFKIELGAHALYQNAVITLLTAIVSLLGFYVFGAVWDDKDKRERMNDCVDTRIPESVEESIEEPREGK